MSFHHCYCIYLNCIASFGSRFFLPIFSNMVQGRQKTKKVHPNQVKGLFAFYEFFRFPFQFQVLSILSDLAKHVEHQTKQDLRDEWCQITKCGCKITNSTIFSVFLFSSKYLNFEWFGQTCRTSECSQLDLRDECCPFRRRSKVAENGLVQGRKSKYP